MRIRCIANKYRDLPKGSRAYLPNCDDAEFPVKINQEYTVYGICGMGNEVFYSILVNAYSSFPEWFSSTLFTVVEGSMPSCWCYQVLPLLRGNTHPSARFIISYPEWAYDRTYEWDLFEGVETHREIWLRYKGLIDQESAQFLANHLQTTTLLKE